jgi:hypothetical protein
MGRTAHAITIPGNNTARLRTFPVQQLDHRRKSAHNIPLILLILALGGHSSHADDWHSHAVVDGLLVTVQNPASSEQVAARLLQLLGN